jgi:hypothetical protein
MNRLLRHWYPNRPAALILGGVAVLAFGLHLVHADDGQFEGTRLTSDRGQAGFSTGMSRKPATEESANVVFNFKGDQKNVSRT